MTQPAQPHPLRHPLRCGTCNYPHNMKDESGKWKRCPIAKCELSYERLSLIDVVGCNSHSSLRSRPAPAAPERKTPVIDLGKSEYFSVTREEWERMQQGKQHQPPASPDADDTVTMPRWVFEWLMEPPKTIEERMGHTNTEIAGIIEQLRQSQQHPNGKRDVNCNACLEGLCQPCNHPVEGCPYYEPKQDGV